MAQDQKKQPKLVPSSELLTKMAEIVSIMETVPTKERGYLVSRLSELYLRKPKVAKVALIPKPKAEKKEINRKLELSTEYVEYSTFLSALRKKYRDQITGPKGKDLKEVASSEEGAKLGQLKAVMLGKRTQLVSKNSVGPSETADQDIKEN